MTGRLAAALGAVALVVAPAAAPAAEQGVRVSGHVVYRAPGCHGTTAVTGLHPLSHAELVLRRAGGPAARVRLDARGRFATRLRGHGDARGRLRLDGPLLTVAGYGDTEPITIAVGAPIDVDRGRARVTLRVDGAGGEHRAASVWAILARAAVLTERAAPKHVRLAKVVAHVDPGHRPPGTGDVPGSSTAYDHGRIYVDSVSRADEFEPWVLLHEYGHFVLEQVANPSLPASGAHDLELSYPDRPALAWSEGFAHAFAALVQGGPKLGTLCRRGVDLATRPATPRPRDGADSVAYNEIANAGIAYRVAALLGGGRAADGLGALLEALHAFARRRGHGPNDLRDLRDALILGGFERTQGDHDAFSEVWDDQGVLGYGLGVRYTLTPDGGSCGGFSFEADGMDCDIRRSIEVRGPGGFSCAASARDLGPAHDERERRMEGGLPHAWQDDCLVSSDSVWVRFPYLPGGDHRRGRFQVTLRVGCTSHPYVTDDEHGPATFGTCPPAWRVEASSEPWVADSPSDAQMLGPRTVFSLPSSGSVVLAEWAADGSECTQHPGLDCRRWSSFAAVP